MQGQFNIPSSSIAENLSKSVTAKPVLVIGRIYGRELLHYTIQYKNIPESKRLFKKLPHRTQEIFSTLTRNFSDIIPIIKRIAPQYQRVSLSVNDIVFHLLIRMIAHIKFHRVKRLSLYKWLFPKELSY